MNKFELGESVDIEDLSEEDARFIFGNEFYESWVKRKKESKSGYVTITSIEEAGLIGVGANDSSSHK